MLTVWEKAVISAISALIFLIIAAPATYKLTNKIIKTENADGCPSMQGVVIHAVVFFIIVFLIMLIPMGKKN